MGHERSRGAAWLPQVDLRPGPSCQTHSANQERRQRARVAKTRPIALGPRLLSLGARVQRERAFEHRQAELNETRVRQQPSKPDAPTSWRLWDHSHVRRPGACRRRRDGKSHHRPARQSCGGRRGDGPFLRTERAATAAGSQAIRVSPILTRRRQASALHSTREGPRIHAEGNRGTAGSARRPQTELRRCPSARESEDRRCRHKDKRSRAHAGCLGETGTSLPRYRSDHRMPDPGGSRTRGVGACPRLNSCTTPNARTSLRRAPTFGVPLRGPVYVPRGTNIELVTRQIHPTCKGLVRRASSSTGVTSPKPNARVTQAVESTSRTAPLLAHRRSTPSLEH